ncbi:MAG: hypothetical protein ABSA97_08955 [Verrucomicrobiia bacterium]
MKRWVTWTIIGLGIVALVSVGRQLLPPSGKDLRLASIDTERAVAFRLGKLIRDSLPGDGEILVVQLKAGEGGPEAGKQIIKALHAGIGRSSSRIVDVSPDHFSDEQEIALRAGQRDGAWGGQFLQWVDRGSRPRAIVSFMGLPSDVPAEKFRALGPIVAVGSTGKFSVNQWLANRNVFAWVIPRLDFNGVPPRRASLEELFNIEFELRLGNR